METLIELFAHIAPSDFCQTAQIKRSNNILMSVMGITSKSYDKFNKKPYQNR